MIVLTNEQSEDGGNVSKIWKSMIAEVDTDGDGKIKIEDLMKMFESKLGTQ